MDEGQKSLNFKDTRGKEIPLPEEGALITPNPSHTGPGS